VKRSRTLTMIALLVVFAAVPPLAGRAGFLTDYWALLMGLAVCYAAAGLSLNLLMGYAGQISLGHFALLGVGAFTSGILSGANRLGLPFIVAILGAAVMGGLIAFLIGLPALRLRGLYLAVVTIALSYAAEQSVFRSSFISGGSSGMELPRPMIGSFVLTRNADFLAVMLVLLLVLWAVDVNVTRSKLGRAFQAIRTNEAVAASFGVDVTRYKLLAFVISGAFAGVAGAMYGHLYQFVNSESFGYQKSLLLVIIVVLGGLGSRSGVSTAAVFYALFPVAMIKAFGTGFHGTDLIVGSLLLMYTIARYPGGLAESMREGREKRAVKAVRKAAQAEAQGAPSDEPDVMPRLPEMPRPSGLAARKAEPPGTPLLSVRDVSVSFGGLKAVDRASLDVSRGKIVGLIGPNGAGKTTLFNAISGLIRPDAGSVHLLGQDISRLPAHARAMAGMGRTFQLIGLAKDLSVTQNLLLAQHVVAGYGVASALTRIGKAAKIEGELEQRASDALEALGFERFANTPVKNLSHGQQRIVELGCVLLTAPELVMLDEPSAGMAPGAAENLAVRLRDVRDELGRTVLLIEHNIPLVLDVCDELYVLSSGEMLAHGAPEEVVHRADVIDAYLGEAVSV